jgi:negative regulator of flagellin synthesis FlgM
MINRVGDSKAGRIDVARVGADRASSPVKADGGAARIQTGGALSAAAEMVAKGPPVDVDKVAAIKAAIAEGRYPVDPIRIAEGMIALGFGPKS